MVRIHADVHADHFAEAGGVLMTWQMDLSWQADALCVGRDTNDFYTHGEDRSSVQIKREYQMRKEMVEYCAPCPVQDACLAHALQYEHHGIWAGTTPKERRDMRVKLNIICTDPTSMHEQHTIAAHAKIRRDRDERRQSGAA